MQATNVAADMEPPPTPPVRTGEPERRPSGKRLTGCQRRSHSGRRWFLFGLRTHGVRLVSARPTWDGRIRAGRGKRLHSRMNGLGPIVAIFFGSIALLAIIIVVMRKTLGGKNKAA